MGKLPELRIWRRGCRRLARGVSTVRLHRRAALSLARARGFFHDGRIIFRLLFTASGINRGGFTFFAARQ